MQEGGSLMGTDQRGTRYVFAGTRRRDEEATKICPQCGEVLFADMDICYGCLYEFPRVDEQRDASELGLSLVEPQGVSRGHRGSNESRGVDPLDGIDLDEIDDDAADGGLAYQDETPPAPPRHRKLCEASADATMDLAASEPPEVSPGRVCGFRILARSTDMQVHIPLTERGLSIGRGETNDVVLNARSVSRTHLRLVPLPDKVLAQDCGATNPATIDGKKLEGTASLRVGDLVVVCGTEFEVEDAPPDPAA